MNLNNKNKKIYLDINYYLIRDFHVSMSLNTNKDENILTLTKTKDIKTAAKTQEEIHKEAYKYEPLSDNQLNKMNEEINEFKNAIKNMDPEVIDELKDVNEFKETFKDENNFFLKTNEWESSGTLEQLFPKYKEWWEQKHKSQQESTSEPDTEAAQVLKTSEPDIEVLEDSEFKTTTFEAMKRFSKAWENCKEQGIPEECIKYISIGKTMNSVPDNFNNKTEEEKVGIIVTLFKAQWEQIRNIRLGQIMDAFSNLNITNLSISVNPVELAGCFISYRLLLRTFNKYYYDKPFPTEWDSKKLKHANRIKFLSQTVFVNLVAPSMVLATHFFFKKEPLLSVNVNLSNESNNIQDNLKKSNIFWILALLKKNKWSKLIFIISFILALLYLYNISYIFYIKNSININYISFIKWYLIIIILLIIFFNVLYLLILKRIEKKGKFKISKNLPKIFHTLNDEINSVVKSKAFIKFIFKNRVIEILLYICLLLITLIFL